MLRLADIVELKSGTPQFRIKEAQNDEAPSYFFYGQSEIESDLAGTAFLDTYCNNVKHIRTNQSVSTLREGDLVFSLTSGKAAIVSKQHDGYLATHNFIRINPKPIANPEYLAYLLNEKPEIRRQLVIGQQGTSVMKFTVNQLSDLQLLDLPPIEKQEIIGKLYFNQLRLESLEKHKADLKTKLVLHELKGASQ